MVVETALYDLLAVETSASAAEISKSYKRLALKFHPDKTNHDPQLTETFKEMTRAYEVLTDDNKRQVYDQYGESGLDGSYDEAQPFAADEYRSQPLQTSGSRCGSTAAMFGHMFSEFADILHGPSSFSRRLHPFGDINSVSGDINFPMRTKVSPAPPNPYDHEFVRSHDIHHTCNLRLADLYYGKSIKLQLPRSGKCTICNGVGGLNPKTCRVCQGNGRVVMTHYNEFLTYQQVGSCKCCNGTGIYINPKDICFQCNQLGYTREKKLLKINVLPGTKHEDKIILQGEGDEGRNIIPGDVIIHINEIPHAFLVRKYHDLYMEYDINLKTALIGGEILINNFLKENQSLKVYINVHGNPSLNADTVQCGEVLGTINSGDPKIVRGFGMPINEAVSGGEYVQNLDEVDYLLEVCFDLNRYKKGNLFINFNVKMPSITELSEQGLVQLQSILPDTISLPPKNATLLSGYLAAIPTNKEEYVPPASPENVDSESESETFHYDDIDITDTVEGEDKEEERFYDQEWSNELNKRRKI